MNDSTVLFFGCFALAFLILNIIASINIVKKLNTGGEKADLRWIGFRASGYAKRDKEIAITESGQPGMPHNLFVASSALFFPPRHRNHNYFRNKENITAYSQGLRF